jgi:hypothetical protein
MPAAIANPTGLRECGKAIIVSLAALDQLCQAVSIPASVTDTLPDFVGKARWHALLHI